MSWLKIELDEEQERLFEFRMYQFQGLQIAMNQFLGNNEFEYNEEHYKRLTDTYMEKYRLLSEYIRDLLKKQGYTDIPVKNLMNYEYTEGILKILSPQANQT